VGLRKSNTLVTVRPQAERTVVTHRITQRACQASLVQEPGRRGALDEETIRDFLQTDYRRLVAGLSLLGRSQALAEDAVQEALARAWERGERGEHIESLKAWVTVVANNLLRSAFRRFVAEAKATGRLKGTRDPAWSRELSRSDDRVDVVRAIRDLTDRQRKVVVLHYFSDLSVEDIARAVGSSPGAVKGLLHRARRGLAEALAEETPEEVDDVARGG
jgi:RNA polymerase sigma-70 factor (ECF subfamily)